MLCGRCRRDRQTASRPDRSGDKVVRVFAVFEVMIDAAQKGYRRIVERTSVMNAVVSFGAECGGRQILEAKTIWLLEEEKLKVQQAGRRNQLNLRREAVSDWALPKLLRARKRRL